MRRSQAPSATFFSVTPEQAVQPPPTSTRLILLPTGGLDRFCAVFSPNRSRPRAEANFGGIVWRKLPNANPESATYVGEWASTDRPISPELCVSAMEVTGAFPGATLVLLGFTNPCGYQLPVRTIMCGSVPFLVDAGYIGQPQHNTNRAQTALRIFVNPQDTRVEGSMGTRSTPSPAAPPRSAPGAPRARRHRHPIPGARALDFDGEVEDEEEDEEPEEFLEIAAAEGREAVVQALGQQMIRQALSAQLMQHGEHPQHARARERRQQLLAQERPYIAPRVRAPRGLVFEGGDGQIVELVLGTGRAVRRPREPSPPRESDVDKRRRLLAELERTGSDDDQTACLVCFEPYATHENNVEGASVVAKLNISGCTHSVCPACYQGMLESGRSVRCPACRNPIREIYPDGCIDCLTNAGEIESATVRLSPCEHTCLCTGCARQRARDLDTKCPVCASDYSNCRVIG